MTAAVAVVENLTEQIRPLLAGRGAAIQGAVLADLLATWLAGHIVIGNPDETRKLRAELLSSHLTAVRSLVAIEDGPGA